MKKKVRNFVGIILSIVQWMFGLFFLLGGLTYIGKSVPAAVAMILLGALLLPVVWRKIRSVQPKYLGRATRAVLVLVLFVIAVVVTPQESTEPVATTAPEAPKPQPALRQDTVREKTIDQQETITDIYLAGATYSIRGTGQADTSYTLEFANDKRQEVKTDKNGTFVVPMSKDDQVFGHVELTRDTNGWWFGGKQTYKKLFYALDGAKPKYNEQGLEPVILGVAGAPNYNVSGYYLPNATLLLKSGDKTLATATVDRSGRFEFIDTHLEMNYTPVSILERTSSGWFSSKENVLVAGKYLDFEKHAILSELPTYTKEETETQSIPFVSQTVESATSPKGETRVTQNGVDGKKTIIYKVTFKGNQQVSKTMKSEAVTKEPVAKITTIGSYVAPAPTPQPSSPVSSGSNVYYANCTEVRKAGAAPILKGQPGYRSALDRDNDGIACDT